MSGNQIGSILLFILAIPLGIFAVYSWRASKERWKIIDRLLKDICKQCNESITTTK